MTTVTTHRSAWRLALALAVLGLSVPLDAQTAQPNGHQFGLTVTSAAIVHLTVPPGTTFCSIGVSTNPINYDVGTNLVNAAPTTANGIEADPGQVIQFASYTLCRNFGAIAQGSSATLNALYFR